jgi:hypothetical protein
VKNDRKGRGNSDQWIGEHQLYGQVTVAPPFYPFGARTRSLRYRVRLRANDLARQSSHAEKPPEKRAFKVAVEIFQLGAFIDALVCEAKLHAG